METGRTTIIKQLDLDSLMQIAIRHWRDIPVNKHPGMENHLSPVYRYHGIADFLAGKVEDPELKDLAAGLQIQGTLRIQEASCGEGGAISELAAFLARKTFYTTHIDICDRANPDNIIDPAFRTVLETAAGTGNLSWSTRQKDVVYSDISHTPYDLTIISTTFMYLTQAEHMRALINKLMESKIVAVYPGNPRKQIGSTSLMYLDNKGTVHEKIIVAPFDDSYGSK